MAAAPNELESSLNKLSVHPQPLKSSPAFKKKQAVADSWEEEDSGEDTDRPLSPQQSSDFPAAPPPTPSSPSTSFQDREIFINPFGYDGTSEVRSQRSSARPSKTDAVAKRMVAGALGVKAPKKTEEQRAYEKAVKEKELKRRDQEKENAVRAKQAAERAKAVVWDE